VGGGQIVRTSLALSLVVRRMWWCARGEEGEGIGAMGIEASRMGVLYHWAWKR
jgi:hypothetical protein